MVPLVIVCISKYLTYCLPTDNDQKSIIVQATEGCDIETYHAHSLPQIVQKSPVAAPGIIIQNREGRQTASLSCPTFRNAIATNIEIKREATDQGMLTFLSVENVFSILFVINQNLI